MNTTTKRIVTGALGAAIASIAAPAVLFLGAGTAQAAEYAHEAGPVTITQRAGHVDIFAQPQQVTPPLVWGPFPSVAAILAK